MGSGALPVVVFGHGTGNSVNDPGLDDELLATGAAKLHLEFAGWTGAGCAQFRLPAREADSGAIHAFVTKGTLAGVAACEQLTAFLGSVWAGAPRVVEPPTCAGRPLGCDFRDAP